MLSIQEVQALLRACQADTSRRPYSKTAQRLVDSLGFGRIVGKHWLVTDADRDRIRAYLQSVEDIDATTSPDAWLGRNRIEATQLGRNEKLAGRRPREGRIALRAPAGLRQGASSVLLPAKAFLDIPVDAAVDFRHDVIVLVENFEAFIHFEDARIDLPFSQPLVAFRGDGINTADAVLEFLGNNQVPVIAWPDLDPAGLLFGAGLPQLTGILAPADPEECLSKQGRDDLYLSQLQQLDALHLHGQSFALEQAIRNQRKGIDQERMIAERIPLILWTT